MNNLVNLGNHISNYTVKSAIAGAVGYGLTRTFTTLNPFAGATFFGAFIFAGAVIDPVFITIRKTDYKSKDPQSNLPARCIGVISKIALAYLATAKLTPVVDSTIRAIATEILSTGSLIKDSISLPSLPSLSLRNVGGGLLVTAIALGILNKLARSSKKDQE